MLALLLALIGFAAFESPEQLLSEESIRCRLIAEEITSFAPPDIVTAIASLPYAYAPAAAVHPKNWGDRSVPASTLPTLYNWNSSISASPVSPIASLDRLEQALTAFHGSNWRRENTHGSLRKIYKTLKLKTKVNRQLAALTELSAQYSTLLNGLVDERLKRSISGVDPLTNRVLVELVLLNALRASNFGWPDLWAVSQAEGSKDVPNIQDLELLVSDWLLRAQRFLSGMDGLGKSGLILPYLGERSRLELNFVATLPILTVESATTTGHADGLVHTPLEKGLHDLLDHAPSIWTAFSGEPLGPLLKRYFSLMSIYQKALSSAKAREREWIADLLFSVHERPSSFRFLTTPEEFLQNLEETALQSIFYRSSVPGDYTHSFDTQASEQRIQEIKKALSRIKRSMP